MLRTYLKTLPFMLAICFGIGWGLTYLLVFGWFFMCVGGILYLIVGVLADIVYRGELKRRQESHGSI
jgi:hypothetical protein